MEVLEAVGLGLAGGAVGTVALTLSERAEMALTGRDASTEGVLAFATSGAYIVLGKLL